MEIGRQEGKQDQRGFASKRLFLPRGFFNDYF